MNIYTARFPEISGYLTVLADTEIRARRLAVVWFRHRFHRDPDIAIDADNTDWELGGHTLAPRARHEGIAYWKREQGWIIVPPDFDDPGAYYRSLPPVRCFEFCTCREDARTLPAGIDFARGGVRWFRPASLEVRGHFIDRGLHRHQVAQSRDSFRPPQATRRSSAGSAA